MLPLHHVRVYFIVTPTGLEPVTPSLKVRCSNPSELRSLFVPPVGLEPTNSEEEGFTVPCNCHYATSANILR